MWFRMQMRRQQEAQAAARRSLLVGQALTLMIAIAAIVSFFGTDLASEVGSAIASIRLSTPLLIAVATWILLAPIGWVAIRQK
jgi:hypothetical protein